jgi:hypothetical protein
MAMPAPAPTNERTASSEAVRRMVRGRSWCRTQTLRISTSMRSASSTTWSQAAHSASVTSSRSVSAWLAGSHTRLGLCVSVSDINACGSVSELLTMMATSSSPLISRCSRKPGASSVTNTSTAGQLRRKRLNSSLR